MKRFEFRLYYSHFANFGDLLNELLLESLFPVKVKQELFPSARLIGVGSILDRMLDNSHLLNPREVARRAEAIRDRPIHVWGSGLMYLYDPKEQKPLRPLIIHALRGELTKAQISAILGREVNCVLGDPGLLASRVVPAGEKWYDMGIIPHHHDMDDPLVEKLLAHYPNSIVIDPRQRPEIVLPLISQCRRVLSSSLHGLVVADAYGIPSCWCELSDKVEGSGYKFHDYFSVFGTDREPFDLRGGATPDPERDFTTSFSDYGQVEKIQKALLRCFPRSLLLRAFWQAVKKKIRGIMKKLRKKIRKLLGK